MLAAALMSSAALALLPVRGSAQQVCGGEVASQSWPSPLDRRIALRARDVSLREALDRVAAAARFRVSYSAEFLPLDRRVCITSDSIVAGDAIAELLAGVNVSSIVTGSDHVVIAPSRPDARVRQEPAQMLERVVVTGSAVGNAQRSLSIALDVIDRQQLDRQTTGSLSSSFDGSVAGMWVWEQSPSSLLARYGSIRGASSFGVSYPKVYIDGIEVANPLLLTELNPASLERVEVIRGPQGAALYGADAISGVVNIITRHEGLQAGASRTEFVSRAGLSKSSFSERSVLAQNHSLNWRAGSNVRSGSLGVNVSTLGGYVPDAYSRDVKLNAGFRMVTSGASVTGTARFYAKSADVGRNPLILDFVPTSGPGPSAPATRAIAISREDAITVRDSIPESPQSVKQYTVGITSTLLSGTTWVPSFSAGVDGYRLYNVSTDQTLIPSALDSAFRSAEGGADRMTFRSAAVGQYELAPQRSLTMTFAVEHSYLRETLATPAGASRSGTVTDPNQVLNWRSNSGLVGQANLALNGAVYLTGGARIERNSGGAFTEHVVALPMAGLAFVRDIGPATVKLRSAYGVGIRPARSATRTSAIGYVNHLNGSLDPERQAGTELGADVFLSRRFALHVTRFDQTASGLIQPVAIPRDMMKASNGALSKRPAYVLQNVGEITNRGWEVESSLDLDAFTLGGAFTAVDSRVQRIANNYIGELRVGDRMLAVPAGTASLSASWNMLGWRSALSASRAFDWVNYDRLKLAKDYASCDSCTTDNLTGPRLRGYWMDYDGVTRLRASVARDLPRGLGLRLTIDNLTNVQKGEPDNITVLPGRTVLLGLSARIR
jgi:outer membrane receptor protein involved in Fe transport